MKIEQWITQLEESYESAGSQLSSSTRASLLNKFTGTGTVEDISVFENAEENMMRLFFRKVVNGETFGSISRIKEIMGKSLEDNYKLSGGPFFNLAKVYWTFKIELQDLFSVPNPDESVLSRVLQNVEVQIAEAFFPHPLAKVMPTAQRVIFQERVLKEFAPEIDTKKFIAENPIIKADAARGGCLGTIFLMVLMPIVFLVALAIIVLP